MKKILNSILHPIILPLLWFVYLLSFCAGVARYFFINNPTHPLLFVGKIASLYWHLSPLLLTALLLVLATHVWSYTKKGTDSWSRISLYLVGTMSIFTFFLANYMLGLELSKFSNYLYSTYGITKNSIYWLSNVSLMTMVIFGGFIYYDRKKEIAKRNKMTNNRFIGYLALGVLVWYSLMSLVKVSDYIWYARFKYDWVFENYKKIEMLKKFAPHEEAVIIPPQSLLWPDLSNAPIVRYFLFPRTIVSGSYLVSQDNAEILGEAYFANLHKSENSWPVIDQEIKTVNFGGTDIYYSELVEINNSAGVYKITF